MADLVEDIEIIVSDLIEAYDYARDYDFAMMTFQSMVGARFEERVRRVSDALMNDLIDAKKPADPS